MPDTKQLESFAAGTETAVDVAQIERQLRDLWQLAAQSQKDPTNRRITRACLFSLIVYCETDDDRDQITGIISEVTSRHPCRAIVILAKPGEAVSAIGASITAHCHLAGSGGKQVCCEQISIHAEGRSVALAPGAILPLLESDLPSVLWWRGNFLQHLDLFHRLAGVSDRVLFDTTVWPAPVSLRELAGVITTKPEINGLDLSWTRLAPWQEMIAEAFNEPRCVAVLSRLDHCEIVHGCAAGAELRARLLASWLAVQLGWSVADARQRISLNCQEDGDATAIGLLSVTLKGQDITVTVRKNHGQQTASVVIDMPDACGLPRTRALLPTDDTALLCQELEHSSSRTVYARALAMAVELSGS